MAKVVKILNAIGAEINSEQYIDETMRMGKYKSMSTRPIMMKMTTRESKKRLGGKKQRERKRGVWERSPKGDSLDTQLSKRTKPKN